MSTLALPELVAEMGKANYTAAKRDSLVKRAEFQAYSNERTAALGEGQSRLLGSATKLQCEPLEHRPSFGQALNRSRKRTLAPRILLH